jgi:sterol desaturase/sphingolipid hydroxylase (fatty acid hydroxylase superfamily)
MKLKAPLRPPSSGKQGHVTPKRKSGMTEVVHKLSIATRIGQAGCAARDLAQTVSESRTNYWASYVTDLTCPFLFAYLGMRHGWNWPSTILSFSSGVAVFSLIEYSIHRWLLHDPRSVLFQLHEAHHNNPEKHSAFFFPTSIVILTLVWLLLAKALHIQSASFFICGIATGYCYFGALHHLEHTTRINQIPFRWLQKRWAAHSVHHHLDRSNFGVITSFWDHVFGTQQNKKKRMRFGL